MKSLSFATTAGLTVALAGAPSALDHREAPFVAENPRIDGADLFAFRSYEAGREDFVTLIATYQPLQDPYAGPIYYPLDDDAVYDIHVDRDGDAQADVTFRFRFRTELTDAEIEVGPDGEPVEVPIFSRTPAAFATRGTQEILRETYTLEVIENGTSTLVAESGSGATTFEKPLDNVGELTFPEYQSYAGQFVHDADFPDGEGRVFVGQREDPFAFNMGDTFDLVTQNLIGRISSQEDDLSQQNVTALAIEVPVTQLEAGEGPIGIWTTASLPSVRTLDGDRTFEDVSVETGPLTQVSRVGSPLVNTLLVGYEDKDLFNATAPDADAPFREYFALPALPELIEGLEGITAPDAFPREDLIDVYLRGLPGLNATGGAEAQMLRFRYDVPPVPAEDQHPMGVLGGDDAGYPNGRRPGDDVTDITINVLMGALLPPSEAPAGDLPLTDGSATDASRFAERFPYLDPPLAGSPEPEPASEGGTALAR